ncbi:hypothetical protein Tco_1431016 [Tanacetum coccineum]
MFTACSCFIGGKDGMHSMCRGRGRVHEEVKIAKKDDRACLDQGGQRLEYDMSSRLGPTICCEHCNGAEANHGDPQSDTLQNELTFLIHSFMVNVIPSHRRINKCIWMSSTDVLYVDIHIPYLDLLEKLSKDPEPIVSQK